LVRDTYAVSDGNTPVRPLMILPKRVPSWAQWDKILVRPSYDPVPDRDCACASPTTPSPDAMRFSAGARAYAGGKHRSCFSKKKKPSFGVIHDSVRGVRFSIARRAVTYEAKIQCMSADRRDELGAKVAARAGPIIS